MTSLWMVSMVLQWLAIVALSVVALSLVRQLGIIAVRLNPSAGLELAEGPGPGSELPADEVQLYPEGTFLAGGSRERPLLIATLSPDCSVCTTVAGNLRTLAKDYSKDIDILVAVKGTPRLVREFVEVHSLGSLPVALDQNVPKDMTSQTTPSVLALTAEGTVAARGVPHALDHLEEMARAGRRGVSLADNRAEPTKYAWGEALPLDTETEAVASSMTNGRQEHTTEEGTESVRND